MAQLTRLSLVVTLCFLGTVGVGQVTPSGNATARATPKVVVLKCGNMDSGTFKVKPAPNTVIFVTRPECPLKSFQFDDPNASNYFTPQGTDSDGYYVYGYIGKPITTPFSFHYNTDPLTGGNGTGVIKN
jgi:hypothetical protein